MASVNNGAIQLKFRVGSLASTSLFMAYIGIPFDRVSYGFV